MRFTHKKVRKADKEHPIANVLAWHRANKDSPVTMYYVKWTGYDDSHNSWEPADHLNAECLKYVEEKFGAFGEISLMPRFIHHPWKQTKVIPPVAVASNASKSREPNATITEPIDSSENDDTESSMPIAKELTKEPVQELCELEDMDQNENDASACKNPNIQQTNKANANVDYLEGLHLLSTVASGVNKEVVEKRPGGSPPKPSAL